MMEENRKSILFLHGYTQNSLVFRNRLKVLLSALEKNFKNTKFLFPDAPFVLEENEKSEEIKRAWLFLDEANKLNSTLFEKEKEVTYFGLKESLNDLSKLNEENNYDIECIIAFSQGSLLATFLSILISQSEMKIKFPRLKCVIIVAGFIYPMPKNEEIAFYLEKVSMLYQNDGVVNLTEEEKIQIPSLHVFGSSDPYIIPEKSDRLTHLFAGSEKFIHEGKHYVPTKKEDIQVYINFLKKYLTE